jgi:hypothetical protein
VGEKWILHMNGGTNKQASKQTSKQATKQPSKQTVRQKSTKLCSFIHEIKSRN